MVSGYGFRGFRVVEPGKILFFLWNRKYHLLLYPGNFIVHDSIQNAEVRIEPKPLHDDL